MKIVISSGHGKKIRGASGYIDEVDEARRVVEETARVLRTLGVETITYHDDISTTQNENLKRIVDFHNNETRDLDVSIHFNAYETTSKPMGTECLYLTQDDLADEIATGIARASGLIDRGPKKRTNLYFLNNTDEPAVLVEVCFVDSQADVEAYQTHFNDICAALAGILSGEEVRPGPTPPPEPAPEPSGRPMLEQGDSGPYVVELQKKLGVLIDDGDFGTITDTWVRAFQAAVGGISVDGKVGDTTWEKVDDLQGSVDDGEPPLPQGLADQIYTLAQESKLTDYSWPGRGLTPPGYIAGMALSFAYAMRLSDDPTEVMSKAQGNPDKDALAWYEQEFAALGMSNKTAGIATLRHLFVMMIGLGPRESSGKYCEGRDMSADNVQSDTCEAGLFQTSWNIRNASSAIGPLIDEFWINPNGFLPVFKEGVSPTANNLNSYGSGDGVRYQFLSRFCPLFHVMVTGVGLRTLRAHWGPVNRREVTLKKEADDLLQEVQNLVEAMA